MNENNAPKIKNTVGYKLLKSVFALYVVIAVLITAFHMYSEYDNEKHIVHEDMKNVEKIFLKQLTTSVWNFDTLLVEDIISGILVSRSIIGVSIKNNEDKVLANFGIVDNNYRVEKNTVFSDNVKVSYQSTPYSYSFTLKNLSYNNGESLGSITLFSNDNVIYHKLKNNFLLIVINSIIKTFALWLIFLFFANKYLTKPFFEIITVTNDVDSQKLDKVDFQYNSFNKNEFDVLKKTFNDMFHRLEYSYKELDKTNQQNVDLNKNLEEKVQDRTFKLEKSNTDLAQTISYLKETQDKLIESEKLASLGLLVSGVAHEINTPIGIGITGASHFLHISEDINERYNNEEMTEEDFKEYLLKSEELANLINSNLLRTAQLVKSFKKISIEKMDENKTEINVKEFLQKVVLKTDISLTPNILVDIKCEDDLHLDIYKESFSQVISNLIINSIRHGFGKLQEGNISIEIIKKEKEVHVVYRDDGKGILEENLAKIFEPFFTTNREAGGTGLGLNIIHNIITKIFRGSISCTSKINEGVEFYITLPVDNQGA